MKKTFKELNEIDLLIGELYKQTPDLKNTKFGYAYKKFSEKNYIPTFKERNEKLTDIYIDNALEDETTKALIINDKSRTGFSHSKEALKKLLKEEEKIKQEFDLQEIEIESYISTYIPQLDEVEKDILMGLII